MPDENEVPCGVDNWIYGTIGTVIAVCLTALFGAINVRSGDTTIQPEGEPDPGKHVYDPNRWHISNLWQYRGDQSH